MKFQLTSNLLQLNEDFCFPNSINKRTAVYDFIKDIESNILKDSNSKSKITNSIIPAQ